MAAPRPLGMTAADDWTKEIAAKGLPELQQHYAMLGVPKLVMAKPLLQFPHNYNYVSRAVMYRFMNDQLKLGLENPIVEEDFKPLSIAEMSVWDADHPRPPAGAEFERSLLKSITDDSARQMAALTPTDTKSLAEYRRVIGGAIDAMIGWRITEQGQLRSGVRYHLHAEAMPSVGHPTEIYEGLDNVQESERPECFVTTGMIKGGPRDDRPLARFLGNPGLQDLPIVGLKPKSWKNHDRRIVIWVDGAGKAALFNGAELRPAVKKLLEAGIMVVGVDLLYQGEFRADGKPLTKARRVAQSRDYAGFTYGYNHPIFSERVHDLLTRIYGANQFLEPSEKVYLIGTGGGGPIAAAARAQAGSAIDRLAIDTGHFRFANITSIDDPDFLPGATKYGDLEAFLALSAPHDLWITGESPNQLALTQAAYRAAGEEKRLTIDTGPSDAAEARAVEWLLRP